MYGALLWEPCVNNKALINHFPVSIVCHFILRFSQPYLSEYFRSLSRSRLVFEWYCDVTFSLKNECMYCISLLDYKRRITFFECVYVYIFRWHALESKRLVEFLCK